VSACDGAERTHMGITALAPAFRGETATLHEAALEHLAQRHSMGPKHLVDPGPSQRQLLKAATLALRAPDHDGLRPFRFIEIDDTQREHLGALFAAHAERCGHGVDAIARARRRAHKGPALIALIARIRVDHESVPPAEQLLCTGAALMNFLNALHLMGYGAKTLSGASIGDLEVQRAFCTTGETLLAWIVAGTPAHPARARGAEDARHVLDKWCPARITW